MGFCWRAAVPLVLLIPLLALTLVGCGYKCVCKDCEKDGWCVPGSVTVRFKDGVSYERQDEIIAESGATVETSWRPSGYYGLKILEGETVCDAMEFFDSQDEVDGTLCDSYVYIR